MTTARRRLNPEQRRNQLLEIGARLFAERPYEDVWIEEVAELAGVSRGLMYHYFPTKRDFFAEIVRLASDHLLDETRIDPDLPIGDQIAAGLDAYIGYFSQNQHNVLAVNRGALSGDPAIRAILDAELETLQRRVLNAIGVEGHPREVAATAVIGWLEFTKVVCIEQLVRPTMSADEIRELCLRTLAGALGSSAHFDEPPR